MKTTSHHVRPTVPGTVVSTSQALVVRFSLTRMLSPPANCRPLNSSRSRCAWAMSVRIAAAGSSSNIAQVLALDERLVVEVQLDLRLEVIFVKRHFHAFQAVPAVDVVGV